MLKLIVTSYLALLVAVAHAHGAVVAAYLSNGEHDNVNACKNTYCTKGCREQSRWRMFAVTPVSVADPQLALYVLHHIFDVDMSQKLGGTENPVDTVLGNARSQTSQPQSNS